MNRHDDVLKSAQDAFNQHLKKVVRPALGISEKQEDRLTFAEQAKLIRDADMRSTFVRLAREMVQANINVYREHAMPVPLPARTHTISVVCALLAAALGYSQYGMTGALIGAAVGYLAAEWFVNDNHKRALREAEQHNAAVPEWAESIRDWEQDLEDLRAV